jgi:hypothetical protein
MLAGSAIAFGGHENQLTFNRPVSLPGIVLPAGSYSFDTHWDHPDIVIVRNKERSRVFYMGFTRPVLRPAGMSSKTVVTLGEVRANEVPPVTAWYEIGRALGPEFRH